MSLRINASAEFSAAQRFLRQTEGAYHAAAEHLSTGRQINRAADNPAGLSVVSTLSQQSRGLHVAQRNVTDAISLFDVADSAMARQHALLNRLNELTIQSASDTYSPQDRVHIQDEADQILEEIDRLADTTQFNLRYVLDGRPPIPNQTQPLQLTFQVGANSGDGVKFDFGTAMDRTRLFGLARGQSLDVSTRSAANLAIGQVQDAVETVSAARGAIAGMTNRMEGMVLYLGVAAAIQDQAVSTSRIRDTDIAAESTEYVRSQLMMNAGNTAILHVQDDRRNVLSLLTFA